MSTIFSRKELKFNRNLVDQIPKILEVTPLIEQIEENTSFIAASSVLLSTFIHSLQEFLN